jgi:DHA2 family multidrug resistance protein-like MFS transporter
VADELPDRLGAGLLDAAREAFTQGLQLTAITSAALALGMAILVMVLLQHVRAGYEPEADTEPAGAVAGGAGIEKILGRSAEVRDDCAPGNEES